MAQHRKAHSSKSTHSGLVDPGGAVSCFCASNLTSFVFHSYCAVSCFTLTSNILPFLLALPFYLQVEGVLEDRNARRAALEALVREVLFQIIRFVNEKKDHVPPIPNIEGAASFPYEITIRR